MLHNFTVDNPIAFNFCCWYQVGGSNNGGEGDGSVCVPNAVNVSTDVVCYICLTF